MTSPENKRNGDTDILIGEAVSSTTYDEVFLSCTTGYCIFDQRQNLQAFSSDFPKLYPTICDQIKMGMSYRDYMKVFFENSAIQNMGPAVDLDEWLHSAMKLFEKKNVRHTHHLHDGRWMQIAMSNTTTGHWLFVATDITELRESQLALEIQHQRYRSFARMAMDWFWELDSDLRYIYHSGHQASLTNIDNAELVGMSRSELIELHAINNDELRKHNQLLHEHKPLDVVLSWRNSDNSIRHVNVIAQPEFDKNGIFTGYHGCGREVTQEIKIQSQLNYLAEHDDLTGLVNRRAFESVLHEMLSLALKRDCVATLCFIDLDQFKLVNDGGGHDAGDQLLKKIADTFCRVLGEDTVVARLGGDEFGVILRMGINDALKKINELIQHVSSTPFAWKQRKYTIGASAGLVAIDESHGDMSELMSRADTACYMAKHAGRNQAQIYMYDEYFQDPISLELKQVNLLRYAMDNDGLMLYLQPIKTIQFERSHTHFEVLLRLRDEQGQVMSAGEFIPVAEKYDLMQHLDKWVLHNSLEELAGMRKKHLDVSFSINLSGNTLSNKGSTGLYQSIITQSLIDPEILVFEVTETVAIKNIETAKHFIKEMKQFGCKFSLDDFGSGLSSFGYLKELSVDYLKIDGSFVRDALNDPTCRAIVSAFNQLSHELGMKTVAEFVEDSETEAMLKELGIDFAQGYGVGKPREASEWTRILLENQAQLKKAS